MEHTATFVGRLVAGIVFVSRMVECRIVDKIIVAIMVVDRMAQYFERVDFGQYKWVELLLEKLCKDWCQIIRYGGWWL